MRSREHVAVIETMPSDRDRGAASVLATAICACLVLAAITVIPASMALAAAQRADGAADSAALAAADVASGLEPGSPCDAAELVATANGVQLGSCAVDGMIVTVQVDTGSGPLSVQARATAGPPTVPSAEE